MTDSTFPTTYITWFLQTQRQLFGDNPSRMTAIRLTQERPETALTRVTVNVWRNHAFEPLLPILKAYALYSGIDYDIRLSSYDDTLTFTNHSEADLECIWLDIGRYHTEPDTLIEWIKYRIITLRRVTRAAIILISWADQDLKYRLHTTISSIPGVFYADLGEWARLTNTALLDERLETIAATRLARPFMMQAAKALACRWWAACLLPPIKAIAIDLDNTLHTGVLAEAGVDDVDLNPGHLALHDTLRAWRARGVLLALITRNEREDVLNLFRRRRDYHLELTDFDAVEASWEPKSKALRRIAQQFNIGTDTILFIDDHPGELLEVFAQLPDVKLLWAHDDAARTASALDLYPGLWRWTSSNEDTLRSNDIAANAQRTSMRRAAKDINDYYAALKVRIRVYTNPKTYIPRLHSLSERTNQFNLTLRRLTASELATYMEQADAGVVAIALEDQLSDSGVIGLIAGKRNGDILTIEEICLSCRAIGRGLENALLLPAIASLPCAQGCVTVQFTVTAGPRNEPARHWLANLMNAHSPLPEGPISCPASRIFDYAPPPEITWTKEIP